MSEENETVEHEAAEAQDAVAVEPAREGEERSGQDADASQVPAQQQAEGYTPPHFGQMDDDGHSEVNLDLILDVPVTLSMEVGHARVPIRNLLQLNQGSVVELDRTAGEPLDVFVNGTLIAHGEVVVVNDKFGVRLLDVVSPSERIRKLKK